MGADGISGSGVDGVGVAEVLFGVVDVLGEGGSVGGDAEEGFAVFVSSGFGECFGDLIVVVWMVEIGVLCVD